MLRKRIFSTVLALGCLAGAAGTAGAAEVEGGSAYCFSGADFSQETSFTGICLTAIPENAGALRLGDRILRPGDVLTAEQVGQITFDAHPSEADRTVTVGYLPIHSGGVEEESAMTLSIRGREDKAPVAEDSALETYKNLETTGKLKVTDPEGEAMTFSLTRQPRRGTVTVNSDGSFTYTPKKNKVGVDSFVYTAADPAGNVSREATVTVTILKPTQAAQYTDTLGRECRFTAEWMRNSGIFEGENLAGERCFSPDKAVTRGEFVTMLVKALEIPREAELVYTGYGEEIPDWLRPYLAAALRSGITEGLDQQQFGPQEPITGLEAARMLENALELPARQAFAELTPEVLTRETAANVLYRAAAWKN